MLRKHNTLNSATYLLVESLTMTKYRGIILCALVTVTALCAWIISQIVSACLRLLIEETSSLSWVTRLLSTILSYGTVFFPFYVLIHLTKKHQLDTLNGCQWKIIRLLITGNFSDQTELIKQDVPVAKSNSQSESSIFSKASYLIFCCLGLQVSYLSWGVLQEKIMTREYTDSSGEVEKFTDSQFLVFVNRILAFAFSGIYLLIVKQSAHQTPLYKYSFCSISNTLSSWCQYEALKFVSFPTQVLAKSAKVIPVMVMGFLISRTKYKRYEGVTAVLISIGMAAFLLGSSEDHQGNTVTTVSGAILLIGYLLFDSFTANWQGALFKEHKPSSVQMMCGVNLMSCAFTLTSLIQQGGFFYSLAFATRYPQFVFDCVLTAIASATGQLFIFATIAEFGAVIFTIIMTVRQGLSILLSCILYGHYISASGIIGVMIVFVAIFLRIYYGHKDKKHSKSADNVVSKV